MEGSISTDLVPHPLTGEALELANATDEQLIDFVEACEDAANFAKELKSRASTEFVERLDRSGEWTRRVKIGNDTYEIKAPSPTAGTESFDDEAVIAAVHQLVEQNVIDESAAGKTVRHAVTVTFVTGSEKEAAEIESEAKRDHRYPNVERSKTIAKTGINALLKIPGARESIEACKRVSEPKSAAERKATVKVKGE